MIPRYTRPEMAAIWEPKSRFRIWFEIEAHAADAMAALGIIPEQAARTIWEKGRNATFDVARIDALLGALRDALDIPFTVKTRLGFADAEGFPALLELFRKHRVDLVTVHGRTVLGMYRSVVDFQAIAHAVATLPCPVFANGNVDSPEAALRVAAETGVRGLMIGRGAIRNPWDLTRTAAGS